MVFILYSLEYTLHGFIIQNMNRPFWVDPSRIIDLLQVVEISSTIDVWVI